MPVTFITYADLARDVAQLASQLQGMRSSGELVGVVGIPRSGMIPASMLAQALDLPLGELRQFLRDWEFFPAGNRFTSRAQPPDVLHRGTVLVLDDSIYRGSAMAAARQLRDTMPEQPYCLKWGAIYGSPETPLDRRPDYVVRDVPADRYFEWNLYQHSDLAQAMVDLDGILCHDPTSADNDDGEAYANWIPVATPKIIPHVPLGAICTCRLEKWRSRTEQWLASYHIQYGQLIMMPYATMAERRRLGDYGGWKGRQYIESACKLFLESEDGQAARIAEVSGKPVICPTTGAVHQA